MGRLPKIVPYALTNGVFENYVVVTSIFIDLLSSIAEIERGIDVNQLRTLTCPSEY